MNLRQIRIGPRLGLCFALILLACIGLLAASFVAALAQRDALALALGQAGAQQAQAGSMRTSLFRSAVAIRNMGLQATVEGAQKHEAEARKQRQEYLGTRKALEAAAPEGRERESLGRLAEIDRLMEAEFNEAVGLASQFNTDQAAKVISDKIDPLLNRALAELDVYADLQKRRGDAATAEAEARDRSAGVALGLASALVVAAAALLAWRVTLSITQPMQAAVQAAARVEQGDLASAIETRGSDEAARLLKGLQSMRDSLAGIVGHVRDGAQNISTGANEIATGNVDLSHRTETQASSLQQTAASIEQINAAVKSNADIAHKANEMASLARQAAAQGGQVMGQMVATMEDIRASSSRIGDIIGTIDGIAFQTNILALNAAVEAARAGEQGRGFAVVASEVRSLAGRSAAAASEVRALIGASVEKVQAGSRLAGDAGHSVSDIVGKVDGVATLIDQISASAREQSSGIGQINQAIAHLDQVTQQNAALAEESAAAAESLNQQAGNMVQAVSVFRLA
jgi:methyl-accepting chemotaxis protein